MRFSESPKGNTHVSQNRIVELDLIRGICILLMLLDHALFDLAYLFRSQWFPNGEGEGVLFFLCGFAHDFYFPWILRDLVWFLAVFTFVFLCGLSSSFSRSNFKRGVKLASVALALTLVTFLADQLSGQEEVYLIRFGILHMLAASILLQAAFHFLGRKTLFGIALCFAAVGLWLRFHPLAFGPTWLAAVLPMQHGFYSADYFSLLPWVGFFLLGSLAGSLLYPDKRSTRMLQNQNVGVRFVCFAGKNSLLFYLVHQPLIFGALTLVTYFFF